jgi:hypothetical protein
MNKLWQVIDSLQIICTLPLMNIQFQANADIVYRFLDGNSNMYFSCSNSDETTKEAANTTAFFVYPTQTAFSQQFAVSGFTSKIIFSNIGATVSNMGNVLLASVVILLIIYIIKFYGL